MTPDDGLTETVPGSRYSKGCDLETLMRRYQQADAEAVAKLVAAVSPRLLRFFGAQQATREFTEDALQECWLRIHRARHTYRPGTPVLPWVLAIARHTRVDLWRKWGRAGKFRQVSFEGLPREFPAPVTQTQSALDVARLLAELPESQYDVLYLMKVMGMSVRETASATGSTASAVKQKAHRAYERLRRLLDKSSAPASSAG